MTPNWQRPQQMVTPTQELMRVVGALDEMLARVQLGNIQPALTLSPEAEEALWALTQLRVAMKGFCERAVVGLIEPVHWGRMADLFRQAAEMCDQQQQERP